MDNNEFNEINTGVNKLTRKSLLKAISGTIIAIPFIGELVNNKTSELPAPVVTPPLTNKELNLATKKIYDSFGTAKSSKVISSKYPNPLLMDLTPLILNFDGSYSFGLVHEIEVIELEQFNHFQDVSLSFESPNSNVICYDVSFKITTITNILPLLRCGDYFQLVYKYDKYVQKLNVVINGFASSNFMLDNFTTTFEVTTIPLASI